MRTEPAIEPFRLRLPDVVLEGELVLPPRCVGVVVFAHGSGSSRHSPRNRAVARVLEHAGHADAAEAYREVLSLAPGMQEAKEALTRLGRRR